MTIIIIVVYYFSDVYSFRSRKVVVRKDRRCDRYSGVSTYGTMSLKDQEVFLIEIGIKY